MLNGRPLLAFLTLLFCYSLPARSQVEGSVWLVNRESGIVNRESGIVNRITNYESRNTLSVGEKFYEIAYELGNCEGITAPQAQQAIVFLTAANVLGSTAQETAPLLIKLACEPALGGKQDYSQQVYRWLQEYVSESVDLEVVRKAITYLLDRCDSREQREQLVQQMLVKLGGKNAALDSELATLLGLLMVEKADFKAAQSYFLRAYFNNKYNRLAFAKLVELTPDQITPTVYLEHLRFMLRENLMDMEAALSLAQYTEQLQLYEIAADAYQYCADLFGYLYPNEALPEVIYLPWIISSYNTAQNQSRCLQIAERVRKSGQFDILVEAIAGKAATKIGNMEEAGRIFQAAESQIANRKSQISNLSAAQFAWFYCFARQDSFKALDWANKAYSADPNSPVAAALLAYALVMNQQLEWARPLIENYEYNQVMDLVQAQVQLANGQKAQALQTLKSAVAKDPGSLVAEVACVILAQLGEKHIPPVNSKLVLTAMRNAFGTTVPQFVSPDKIISVRFNTAGNEFSYGSEFGGTIAIVNNSPEPLVISDNGLFNGIRIDASISGDLNKKIPNLVSRKISSAQLVEPGASILVAVRLVTGELRQILLSYPQASLDIEFTLYLEIANGKSQMANAPDQVGGKRFAISDKIQVARPRVELSSTYLQDARLKTQDTRHKTQVAELFIGLLKEQHAMAGHGTLYRYKYADWMPSFLKSALQELITQDSRLKTQDSRLKTVEDQWQLLVHTQAAMLSLPLDSELTNAVAKNLNHPNWPVRLMAVYLLAKSPDSKFGPVLDWIAKNDSSQLVRDMAVALKLETSN